MTFLFFGSMVIYCFVFYFMYEYNKTLREKCTDLIKDNLQKERELRSYRCRYGK